MNHELGIKLLTRSLKGNLENLKESGRQQLQDMARASDAGNHGRKWNERPSLRRGCSAGAGVSRTGGNNEAISVCPGKRANGTHGGSKVETCSQGCSLLVGTGSQEEGPHCLSASHPEGPSATLPHPTPSRAQMHCAES